MNWRPNTTPHQVPLTSDTFSEFIGSHRFVIIHFWAAWNAADNLMQRSLESQIPTEFRELVTFARFNVDPPGHHALCRQHEVLNLPFIAFYRDGSLVRRVTGMRTPEVIIEYLQDLVYGRVA
jgi:hypothetical protein